MFPTTKYPCPHCHAAIEVRSARAFTLVTCAGCGTEWRPRTEIAGYRLLEPLARSGLSVIFRAVAPTAGGSCAVKIIRPPFGTEPHDFERFNENVRVLSGFEHPHWLRIFGGGVEGDVAWLAMEWLPNGSLAGLLIDRGPLAEEKIQQFAAQVATALAAAQSVGLTHHDLQPTNFLLADAHTIKLGGFAEAVFYERAGEELGTAWGRLCCAPPERLFGPVEDVRSEIYALGAVLFELLTGALPYEGEIVFELFLDRLEGPPIRISRDAASIQRSTAEIIDRMLAVDPDDRFQTWTELLDRIEASGNAPLSSSPRAATRAQVAAPRVTARQPAHATTRGAWATIFMFVLIGVIIGGFVWWQAHPPAPVAAKPTSTPSTPASMAPAPTMSPAISAIPIPPPPAKPDTAPAPPPAPTPAPKVAGFDWTGWQTVKLESPKRPKTVHGEAHSIASSSSLRVTGDSTGIDGTTDEHVFHARELAGDWTLQARLGSNSGIAGLAVRASLKSDDVCLAVVLGKDDKVISVTRDKPGTAAVAAPSSPAQKRCWLRLIRNGPVLSAYYSRDGEQWSEAHSLNVPACPAKIPAGFVVWSGSTQKAGATFEEIALQVSE